jgi:hypothetical protein
METAPETATSVFSLSISASKTFFRLAEVPWLTALAIHGSSHSLNPLTVVKLEKGTEDWRYRESLNAADMESLGIDDKSLPLIFSDWVKLEEKIEKSSLLKALRVIPVFYTPNPESESGLIKAHQAHCERLREMLMARNLVAFSLATGVETEITLAYFAHYKNLTLDDPVIELREFEKFASSLRICVSKSNHSEVSVPLENSTMTDFSLLATPNQLIVAFGKYGLDDGLFKNLTNAQWLLKARKVKGVGQKGHEISPMFCPYLVMINALKSSRKIKGKMSRSQGVMALKMHFPKVYERHESYIGLG